MIKKLLVIRFSALGDVALTVPVVAGLAVRHPEIEITVLSRTFCKPLFEKLPDNVKFMGADLKGRHAGFRGLLRLFGELSGCGFDAVADLHDVLRTKLLRLLFGMRGVKTACIDKGRSERKKLVSCGWEKSAPLVPVTERYRDVLRRLGLDAGMDFVSIFGDGKGEINGILDKLGCERGEGRMIGIAPFAAHAGKCFPVNLWEGVIKDAAARYGKPLKIFMFGAGASEKKILEDLERVLPDSVSVAGKLSLGEELALISNLDWMISMDSANMHLASLVNVPVISVWGATHPYSGFMGWRQSADNAVQVPLPCRPCSIYGNKKCRLETPYACLTNLSGRLSDKIAECLSSGG